MALKALQPWMNFPSYIKLCIPKKCQIYSSAKYTTNLCETHGRTPSPYLSTTKQTGLKHQHRGLCTRTEKVEDSTGWEYDKSFTPELDLRGFEDNFEKVVENVSHRKGDADVNHLVSH